MKKLDIGVDQSNTRLKHPLQLATNLARSGLRVLGLSKSEMANLSGSQSEALVEKGVATMSKDATRNSWPYY